jgi:hypothetical protein
MCHPNTSNFRWERSGRQIARIETMTRAEVDDELRRLRIDPAPTLDRVTEYVRRKVTSWRERGLLHLRTLLTHLFLPVTPSTVPISRRRREAGTLRP